MVINKSRGIHKESNSSSLHSFVLFSKLETAIYVHDVYRKCMLIQVQTYLRRFSLVELLLIIGKDLFASNFFDVMTL